jgi:hypothetical protein
LYAENVDMDELEETKVKVKHKQEKDKGSMKGKEKEAYKIVGQDTEDELYESEGGDLWAPYSDDEEVYMKFKAFREEDLHYPKFHVGQVCQTIELLRKATKEYFLQKQS